MVKRSIRPWTQATVFPAAPVGHQDGTGHDMLKAKEVSLIAASAPTFFVEDTPTAVLVRQVLGAVAQFERKRLPSRSWRRPASGSV